MIPSSACDGAHDITPWWASKGLCLDYLETGDVIEVLPNPDYPITMNGSDVSSADRGAAAVVRGHDALGCHGRGLQLSRYQHLDAANPPNTPVNCG